MQRHLQVCPASLSWSGHSGNSALCWQIASGPCLQTLWPPVSSPVHWDGFLTHIPAESCHQLTLDPGKGLHPDSAVAGRGSPVPNDVAA